MENYVCSVCGYIYNPSEHGGVSFESLPEDYECPLCGVGKDMFEKE
ncbi:MAG: rubredoxin [Heliobacteriaceae bacterium]|jgi:rubredoxin|nr:rubredoxin [Heliobacteriaceae bacterium]